MLFNDLFRESHRTILVRGGSEPEYLPADGPDGLAKVVFAHGYFTSALHEISHWCIAGHRRRQLPDYGYWYCPDGRTPAQQQAFEQAEIKPQAQEWLFSVAAGIRFHLSVDNLSGQGAADADGFLRNVIRQAETYLAEGLPERGQQFFETLQAFYGTGRAFASAWQDDVNRLRPFHVMSDRTRTCNAV